MKKVIIFILCATAVFVVGCSDSTDKSGNNPGDSSKGEATSEADIEESTESDIQYATMIPDPEAIFKNGEVSIVDADGGSAYIFQVRGFEEEEYETYVSQCKEMGFTDVSYESETDGGKMFGAYTEDKKYWVEVLLGGDNGILAVTCKESTKNK